MLAVRLVTKRVGSAVAIDISPPGLVSFAPIRMDPAHICEESIAVAEQDPVMAIVVITDHVCLAISIDVGPLSVRVLVAAPPLLDLAEVIPFPHLAGRQLYPMIAGTVIAYHVGPTVSINVSILCFGALLFAPSRGVPLVRAPEELGFGQGG